MSPTSLFTPPNLPLLSPQELPGGHLVAWAQGPGSQPIEAIFHNSTALDGEAVVTFFQALATVSQLELHRSGDAPRVYCLQKMVECAFHNLGRIRLIWTRIWGTLSGHLVATTAHDDAAVARYAVDSLR